MPSKSKKWTGFITQNWQLKLLALLLAILSYFAIRGVTGYEVEYAVPIVVEVGDGIAVLEQDAEVAMVRFRGSQDDLLKLDQRRLRAAVRPEVTDPDGLPRPVPIQVRDITGAPGVTVVKIDPASVMLTFDQEIEAIFPVEKPTTIGRPLEGKAQITFEPQEVILRGPKRRLTEFKLNGSLSVKTEPVDVDGRVESFSKRVAVQLPRGSWTSSVEPAEILVNVDIVKTEIEREWADIPVLAVRNPSATTELLLEPVSVSVMLEGRTELVEKVAAQDIRAFVDCTELDPVASYELPVQVHLPASIDARVRVMPQTVRVSFNEQL